MRKLTIERKKSVVACLAYMNVFIEDPSSNDLEIDGVSCRKLGIVKNGETVTFEIGEEAAKVYAIADQLSKNYCCDRLEIPAGTEDVSLSGKNRYNPATGNAFRFDGNNSEEAKAFRKKGLKKGIGVVAVLAVIAVVIGVVFGFVFISLGKAHPKTFEFKGMNITLTDRFEEEPQEDDEVTCFASNPVAVYVVRDPFSAYEGLEDYTAAEYRDLVIEYNDIGEHSLLEEEGHTGFEYSFSVPDSDETYHYFTYVCKGYDAFYIVDFLSTEKYAKNHSKEIRKWFDSIIFIQEDLVSDRTAVFAF